ncbi:MAG: hypothetical protein AB7E32_00975 [Desulfovibrio sp.]
MLVLNPFRRVRILFCAALLPVVAWVTLCWFAPVLAQAQSQETDTGEGRERAALDFMVVLPGAAETPEEAVRAVDLLAASLSNRTGRSVQGGFTNDCEGAADLLEREPPRWGVVSLGFYLQYAQRLKMTPVASTLPGGKKSDVWRVLTAPEYGDKELAGDFRGSMLFEREAAACLLLHGRSGGIVGLGGDRSPLMSLRDMGRDGLAGVVLDSLQYEAVGHLPYRDDLRFKVLYEVRDLPAAPVVWFGKGADSEDAALLLKALRACAGESRIRSALDLLRTTGFGHADKRLGGLLKECGR